MEKGLKGDIMTTANHMIEIKETLCPDEKSYICDKILRSIPSWFGIDASIVEYVEQVKGMPFYAALYEDNAIGFVALKIHNPFTLEIYVMGILAKHHRRGIGKMLVERCVRHCEDSKIEFLTVKTVDESRENKSYEKTRLFYLSQGFRPLEVFPLLWDKENPCLFMAKNI